MAHLEMQFLGGFHASLDGEHLTAFESSKVRALLAFLATEAQRPHPRESLAALLWPDWPDSAARSNLRYALSDLRTLIGDRKADPCYLLISREAIQFNLESDHRLDVAEIAALESGAEGTDGVERLERAVELYQGEFLEGFSVSEAAPFDDWRRLKQQQLQRCYLEVLHRLAAELEAASEYERALGYAYQLVDVEPMDESAQRQLMRLLAFNGRGGEALVQYETCRDVLQSELGASPSAETTRLYEQILAGQLEAPTPIIHRVIVSRMPAFLEDVEQIERQVFVAREGELERLSSFLDEALSGNGQMAFVSGGPGQGKTALLREFTHRAMETHPDLLVASGNCNAYAGVGDPYLPFREIMAMLSGDVEARWASGAITQDHALRLWRSLPITAQATLERGASLIGSFIPGDGFLGRLAAAAPEDPGLQRRLQETIAQQAGTAQDLEQSSLFEQFTNVLRILAQAHPLLLTLDDLQWADTATISLLFHLGRRLAGGRILIVGAYRPEEVSLGRGGEQHPLDKVLAEFKRQYGDTWVHLGQAGEGERLKLVNDFLDTEQNRIPQDFRQALFQRTEGHPLFTVELLRALQEQGDLFQDDEECWVVSASLAWDQLPDRVEAVIAERIGRLEAEQRELLAVASVEGEDFTAQVVARVQEVDERHMLRQLSQELEKRHRLVREGDELRANGRPLSRYRFAHHLFQRYLYDDLSAGERRLLHGQIAAALEALYADHPNEIAVQLAYHYGLAENREKELTYLSQAGQQALASYAHQEAETYFRRALDILADEGERADLLSGLGEAYLGQSRFAEAIEIFREGIELYSSLGPEGQRGMARLYARSSFAAAEGTLFWRGLPICEEGLAALADAPESRELALLLSEAGRVNCFAGFHEKARTLCEQALAMAERLGALDVQADTLATIGLLPDLSPEEAIEAYNQALEIAEAAGLLRIASRAYLNLGATIWVSGDTRGAFESALRSAELSRKIGNVRWEMSGLYNALSGALALGELAYVEQRLPEYERLIYTLPDPTLGELTSKLVKAILFARQGHLWEALHRVRNLFVEIRERVDERYYPWRYLDQGEIILELQRLGEAVDLADAEAALTKGIEICNQSREGALKIWTHCQLCIFHARQGRIEEAALLLNKAGELAGQSPTILDQMWLKYAQAELSFSKECWEGAIEAFDICSRLLTQAELRPMLARVLTQKADAHIARREPADLERARTLLLEAQSIYEDMGSTVYLEFVKQKLEDLAES